MEQCLASCSSHPIPAPSLPRALRRFPPFTSSGGNASIRRARRGLVVHALNSSSDDEGGVSRKAGASLDERIASGEFTDAGSTKEQLTRPVRKALSSMGLPGDAFLFGFDTSC